MTLDLEEHLEEMMEIGLMTLEEANGYWRQGWDEQERALFWKELEELVESGEMNRDQVDGFLEEIMVMRVAESPYGPSPDTFDPEDSHARPRVRGEALGERASKDQGLTSR